MKSWEIGHRNYFSDENAVCNISNKLHDLYKEDREVFNKLESHFKICKVCNKIKSSIIVENALKSMSKTIEIYRT
jgi:translation initiation factor 2 beta subunit (eIF-2beta)/eIF-5